MIEPPSLTQLTEIAQHFQSHQRILILSHVRPDGDALGSQLALGSSLQAMGKSVTLWNEGPIPQTLNFLPKIETIKPPPIDGSLYDFDLVIALDTANKERLGTQVLASIGAVSFWITIDHHRSNEGYGDLIYVDNQAPATGEIIYHLLTKNHLPFPKDVAEYLYVALSTDTGSFQYPSTTATTYEIAADLLRRGLDLAHVNQRLYGHYEVRRIHLLRELLNTLQFHADQRIAFCSLTLETKKNLNLKKGDEEGLIDLWRGIDSVLVAIWFEELSSQTIRVSLRSNTPSINVCEIAQLFGGGGHLLAAGITMNGALDDVRTQVIQATRKAIEHASPIRK